MNRRDAKRQSVASEISIGELRKMIDTARARGGMSRVNPSIPLAAACDIYSGALAGRDEAEVPAGMKLDPYQGRMRPSRDSLILRNILRDCA